tara:strand:+ start:77 stop:709 length:633 start_codon:yes stop_codon:yes gene_type:complete
MVKKRYGIIPAICSSIEGGKMIQESLPDVASDYQNGKSLSHIVKTRNLVDLIEARTKNIAMSSLYYALAGYNGNFSECDTETYEGLLPLGELEKASTEHKAESGRINGKLKMPKGFAVMDKERVREISQIQIANRGIVPFSRKEEALLLELSTDDNYLHQSGRVVGRINYSLVIDKINNDIHKGNPIRDSDSLRTKLFLLRKKQKSFGVK